MLEFESTPEQQLAVERLEAVCRECHKDPITKRRRLYCASCGKPLAYSAGTVPLPRAEALAKARRDERARCVAIVDQYIGDRRWYDPVKSTANKIRCAILND